ncbi:MAG: zinc ABC transporter substrate-binding protein [Verrucomicrobia bacterium]|nr:zinc ABC transporter substrate-binding protein [Verrucomicrobiota bacterium]
MLRSIFILFFAFLCGCSSEPSKLDSWMTSNGKIKVLSTTAMIDDIVARVGKEKIDTITLVTGDIDPHSYELLKGDDEKLQFAQVIFYNGLGLEHGASLRSRLENNPRAVSMGGFLQQKHPSSILVRDNQIDPHIWLDVALWADIVDPIVEALSKIDPSASAEFQENGQVVKEEMLALHAQMMDQLAKVPDEKKYLVTSHDAFNYFSRRYLGGQDRFHAPEGLAPDGQLSSHDIQRIMDLLNRFRITVLFPESNVSKDSLKKIAAASSEKGTPVKIVGEPLYADALGAPGSDADNYFKMMNHNVRVMIDAWK